MWLIYTINNYYALPLLYHQRGLHRHIFDVHSNGIISTKFSAIEVHTIVDEKNCASR